MNLRSLLKTTVVSFPLAIMVGCSGGGGGSSDNFSTITGIFIDSAVSGVDYVCSSGATGVTNTAGEFTCNSGDRVELSFGGVTLGSVAVGSIITPTTLFPNDSDAALNLAQFLQTFDTDPTTDGISLENADLTSFLTNFGGNNIDFGDSNFDAVIGAALPVGTTLVSEADAQQHLNDTFTPI